MLQCPSLYWLSSVQLFSDLVLKMFYFGVVSSNSIHLCVLHMEVHDLMLRLCLVLSPPNAHIWL